MDTPSKPLRILVVENNCDTLKYLKMYLDQLGHAVDSAQTMRAGLHELQRHSYDVLISDIGLPDGTGWDLLRQAERARPFYAIAMSGYGMNADQARSKEAGFRHHLLKPFVPDELDAMLAQASRESAAPANLPTQRNAK